jgi:MarR family transcriptional regulator, transcriptional regulator for hemolysin
LPYPIGETSFATYKSGGTKPDIRMLVTMVLLVRGFRNKLEDELRKINQSTSRMETLAAILNMPGDKSQTDVARRLRIEGATVTRMIDSLAREGLVERQPHPTDRRINLVRITPEGERELQRIFRIYDMMRDHFLQDISAQEVDKLQGLFNRMLQRLDEPLDTSLHIADMATIDRLRDKLQD